MAVFCNECVCISHNSHTRVYYIILHVNIRYLHIWSAPSIMWMAVKFLLLEHKLQLELKFTSIYKTGHRMFIKVRIRRRGWWQHIATHSAVHTQIAVRPFVPFVRHHCSGEEEEAGHKLYKFMRVVVVIVNTGTLCNSGAAQAGRQSPQIHYTGQMPVRKVIKWW